MPSTLSLFRPHISPSPCHDVSSLLMGPGTEHRLLSGVVLQGGDMLLSRAPLRACRVRPSPQESITVRFLGTASHVGGSRSARVPLALQIRWPSGYSSSCSPFAQRWGSRRCFSSSDGARKAREALAEKNRRLGIYAISIVIGVIGVSYASVPLYKVFCQATGFGGTTRRVQSLEDAIGSAAPEKSRPLKIIFNADVSDSMPWKFWPTQSDILVVPGETALAFYTVKNKTDKGIIGVATYNVHPPKAGLYFNKIQCFCFEEQRLKPKEEIDMPVFFFIDPEILNDATMDNVHEITLSYTFFKTGEEDAIQVEEDESQGKQAGPSPPQPAVAAASMQR